MAACGDRALEAPAAHSFDLVKKEEQTNTAWKTHSIRQLFHY
jgi:hypothetical protein